MDVELLKLKPLTDMINEFKPGNLVLTGAGIMPRQPITGQQYQWDIVKREADVQTVLKIAEYERRREAFRAQRARRRVRPLPGDGPPRKESDDRKKGENAPDHPGRCSATYAASAANCTPMPVDGLPFSRAGRRGGFRHCGPPPVAAAPAPGNPRPGAARPWR